MRCPDHRKKIITAIIVKCINCTATCVKKVTLKNTNWIIKLVITVRITARITVNFMALRSVITWPNNRIDH